MGRILLLTLTLFILNACAGPSQKARVVAPSAPVQATVPQPEPPPKHVVKKPVQPAPAELIKTALYEQHEEWRYTPYRLGGLSKRGIDCSGFVYTTLRSRFGLDDIPRTAQSMASLGDVIPREQVQPGDLVFFKTNSSRTRWHVGIYVDDQQFLHASTSRGVIMSNLDDPYWRSSFQQARRLLSHYH